MPTNINTFNGLFKELYGTALSHLGYYCNDLPKNFRMSSLHTKQDNNYVTVYSGGIGVNCYIVDEKRWINKKNPKYYLVELLFGV